MQRFSKIQKTRFTTLAWEWAIKSSSESACRGIRAEPSKFTYRGVSREIATLSLAALTGFGLAHAQTRDAAQEQRRAQERERVLRGQSKNHTLTVLSVRIRALRFAASTAAGCASRNTVPAPTDTVLNLRDIEQTLQIPLLLL